MNQAPQWWLSKWAKRYDLSSETVVQHLTVYWKLLREGKKRWETDLDALGGEYEGTKQLTSYGRKLRAKRKRAAKIAKLSKRANQRKAAIVRRKRQKKHRRYA